MNMIPVIFSILSLLSFRRGAAAPNYLAISCPNTANFTRDSAYHSNLKDFLNSLPSEAILNKGFPTGYYKATTGEDPDKVYGHFLCRGDVNLTTCQECVAVATRNLTRLCPVGKNSIIWYDECLLRYSNQSFFSTVDVVPSFYMWNVQNYTDTDGLEQALANLTKEVLNEAVNDPKLFATRKVNLNFDTLYGLVQCTQDLSSLQCHDCLQNAISQLPRCCSGKRGGRVLCPSCNLRYELNLLSSADLPPAPTLTPVPPSPPALSTKGSRVTWIAIGTTVSAIVVLLLLGSFLLPRWRRNKKAKEEKSDSQEIKLLRMGEGRIGGDYSYDNLQGEKQLESQELPLFPLALTLEATHNFSDENKLGEGGFGPVYKGVLKDGKEIAVKRLSRASGQGLQEFMNEVTLIAKLQHKNLVRLLGCCLEGNELLLIYEYMPNKSLDFILFDSTRSVQLDWESRIRIINGIARGLLYLHKDSRLRVIHRDLKASNVLLDSEMNPRISDFGMARIVAGNQNEANTNRVVGTYGYMAPEYAMEGLFSIKSDVFSFGVLMLEILSGKKNSGFYLSEHGQSLLNYTWKLWCDRHESELIDPVLAQSCIPNELLKYIHIGLLCVQEDPADRPTMSSVIVWLASDTLTLPQPTEPAFSVGRAVVRPTQSSSDIKANSVNEVTLSNVSPR